VYCTQSRACQLPFETPEQLQAHIDAVHDKRRACEWEGCGKIFRHRLAFREHRKSHFPGPILRNSISAVKFADNFFALE
jgi:hypothetical protein